MEVRNVRGYYKKNSNKDLEGIFTKIDEIEEYNSSKVLDAFIRNSISESDFNSTTGYGYNDIGRDKIERVFADIFKAEAALVRCQFISGTHALTTCFFGLFKTWRYFYYQLVVNHMIL